MAANTPMNSKKYQDYYRSIVIDAIPRILCEMDRDETSINYGCFDREYWAWVTKDFSNIDAQRAVYALSLIWNTKFKENIYYQDDKILKWIISGISYWCRVQHKDGSFDHLYPNEHSFVGAAFTLYEIGEAFKIIEKKLDNKTRKHFLKHIGKAADFIVKNDELHGFISNHRAGAACALFVAYQILKHKKYLKRSYYFIDSINQHHSDEGWFLEYSGPDPGYQTLLTYYLANFYRLSKDQKVKQMLDKSMEFLKYFIHPNGTLGGEYGARNTEVFYPAGFYMHETSLSKGIFTFLSKSLIEKKLSNLLHLDARNFITYLSNYAFVATHDIKLQKGYKFPFSGEFSKLFKESGLYIYSAKRYYAIVNAFKTTVHLYSKSSDDYYLNCGYYFFKKGNLISTNVYDTSKKFSIDSSCINLKSSFYSVPARKMSHMSFLLFRMYSFTIGRIKPINIFLRKHFVKKFILHKNKKEDHMKRKVEFLRDKVIIKDILENKAVNTALGHKFTTIFMATSKYFNNIELSQIKETTSTNRNVKEHAIKFS